jgi:hypothetical protein
MSNRNSTFKTLAERLKDNYRDVRVLLACITIPSDKGTIVVYQSGNGKSKYMVCQGDKRIECEPDEVDNEIEKLM